jgi:hypothetical protein
VRAGAVQYGIFFHFSKKLGFLMLPFSNVVFGFKGILECVGGFDFACSMGLLGKHLAFLLQV